MAVINKKIPKTKSFDPKFNTISLNPAKVNQMIEDQGVRVRVYRTVLCPNRKSIDSAEHEINCSICKTKDGFIDLEPVETWAFVGNQDLTKQFNVEGAWDEQGVVMTFPTGVEVFYWAKIELMDFTTPMIELVQRQDGDIDNLKYPAHSVNVLIDIDGVRYYQDTDFQVGVNGNIQWIEVRRPDKGKIYTLHYNYPVTFRAVNAVHINRFSQLGAKRDHKEPIELPQQWNCKRDFLIERKDLDENLLTPNKIINEQNP